MGTGDQADRNKYFIFQARLLLQPECPDTGSRVRVTHLMATAVHQPVQEQAGTGSPWMLSGHRVHHKLIFDNVVPFAYLLCLLPVLIHLVTGTIAHLLMIR